MNRAKDILYRREPDLRCKSVSGSTNSMAYRMSSITGLRRANEDRFKCFEKFYKDFSYFAIFDGHGGSEVAVYLKRKLHQFIFGFLNMHEDDIKLALELGFMSCDMSLQKPEAIKEMNDIITAKQSELKCDPALKQQILAHLSRRLDNQVEPVNENPDGSVENEKLNNSGTADEEALKLKEPCCEYIEGVAGPSQDMKEKSHKSKTLCGRRRGFKASPELSSDNLSESADDPSRKEEETVDDDDDKEDDDEVIKFQVLPFIISNVLEKIDADDLTAQKMSAEDEETGNDTDEEDIATGNAASNANEKFEMEPGVQSGSTAAVIILNKDKLYVANVGDTRCILSRKGIAEVISVDHTPEKEEERIRILEAGSTIENGRINNELNLSRAFGDFMYKRNPNLAMADQAVSIIPYVAEIKVDSSIDFIVIASSGLWKSKKDQFIVDLINSRMKGLNSFSEGVFEELYSFILPGKLTKDRTGCPNMTCGIVKLHKGDVEIQPEKWESMSETINRPTSVDVACKQDGQKTVVHVETGPGNLPCAVNKSNDRRYGTARRQIQRYWRPSVCRAHKLNPHVPLTSKCRLKNSAKNQTVSSKYEEDDDDDCQIIFSDIPPRNKKKCICANTPRFKAAYKKSENPIVDVSADSDEIIEVEEIVKVDDVNSVKSQSFEVRKGSCNTVPVVAENPVCVEDLHRQNEQEVCTKKSGREPEALLKDPDLTVQATESCIKNNTEDQDDGKESVTIHSGIGVEVINVDEDDEEDDEDIDDDEVEDEDVSEGSMEEILVGDDFQRLEKSKSSISTVPVVEKCDNFKQSEPENVYCVEDGQEHSEEFCAKNVGEGSGAALKAPDVEVDVESVIENLIENATVKQDHVKVCVATHEEIAMDEGARIVEKESAAAAVLTKQLKRSADDEQTNSLKKHKRT